MSFLMESPARARKVAKDLKRLSDDFDAGLTLTQSQAAVAAMFGYRNWNDLLSLVGSRRSEDDGELAPAAVEKRRKTQVDTLCKFGLSRAVASEIVVRLSATDRNAAPPTRANVSRMDRPYDFHPVRMAAALGPLLEETEDPSQTVFEHFRGRVLNPLDAALMEDLAEGYGDFSALDVIDQTGFLVDVTAIVPTLSKDAFDPYWTPPSNWPDAMYLHFGHHALPSPYPGIGVEGCYVLMPQAEFDQDAIELRFVLSDIPAINDEPLELPAEVVLRDLLRGCTVEIKPGESDDMEDIVETSDYEEWDPYLPSLVTIAWSALKAIKAASLGSLDITVSHAWSNTEHKALSRAGTETARREIMLDVAGRTDDLAVRYLGRPAPKPWRDRGALSERDVSAFPVAASGKSAPFDAQWALSFIEDAADADNPVDMLKMIEASNFYMRRFNNAELPFAELSHIMSLTMSMEMNCLWIIGGEHKKHALGVMKNLCTFERDVGDLLPAVVRIMLEDGDIAGARAQFQKWRDSPSLSDVTLLWTDAVISAREGSLDRAAALISRAQGINPLVGGAMLIDPHDLWFWFGRQIGPDKADDSPDAEARFLVGLHSPLWMEIEGAHQMLMEQVAQSVGMGPAAGSSLH